MAALAVWPPQPGVSVGRLDKFLHLCEYLLFAWCLCRALRSSGVPRGWAAWGAASGYGALLEIVQAFLPYRSAEWGDAAANALGAAIGVILVERKQ
ncbi:MAG: VanZ family protein [Candidatus Omnitrophica bacterium]|nr:VanZ family protein [Candidatus Omnitrophota bacterium]